ncbi:MAG: hypothetical protein OXC46_04865 [Thaumarchaeota archaeon]|nr:hypothetical protein [Nitrososphaerota archaeon]
MKVSKINIEKVNGTIQNLQFFGDELNEITIPDEIDNNLDVIIKFVTGKTPDELEFLASVHYWAVRQQEISNNYSADYIFEKLSALNPNRVFKLDDVILAVKTLEAHKFLTR